MPPIDLKRGRGERRFVEAAMKSPWQLSAVLSAASLAGAFAVVPLCAGGHPLLVALAPAGRMVLLAFAVVFGFIALIRSFAREHDSAKTAQDVERGSIFWEERRKQQRRQPVIDVDYQEVAPRSREPDAAGLSASRAEGRGSKREAPRGFDRRRSRSASGNRVT